MGSAQSRFLARGSSSGSHSISRVAMLRAIAHSSRRRDPWPREGTAQARPRARIWATARSSTVGFTATHPGRVEVELLHDDAGRLPDPSPDGEPSARLTAFHGVGECRRRDGNPRSEQDLRSEEWVPRVAVAHCQPLTRLSSSRAAFWTTVQGAVVMRGWESFALESRTEDGALHRAGHVEKVPRWVSEHLELTPSAQLAQGLEGLAQRRDVCEQGV